MRRSGSNRITRCAACAVAVLAMGGCGLLNRKPKVSPAEIAARAGEDARIQREVEARLSAEPSIGAGRVRAEVRGGEVSLFGGVTGLGALRCAERNAGLVRGVRLVIDQLVLDPGPRDVRCLAPRAFPAPRTAGP
ncbi:MAG TPA: BON domain-containing protein [Longimicrobiaceae bacterium]